MCKEKLNLLSPSLSLICPKAHHVNRGRGPITFGYSNIGEYMNSVLGEADILEALESSYHINWG